MMYKFYVRMDGDTFGPYSAKEIRDLELLDDVWVTEESMSEWLPAGKFDFDDMVRKELEGAIGEDGTIHLGQVPGYCTPKLPPPPPQYCPPPPPQYCPPPPPSLEYVDQSVVPEEIKKWNWGACFFNWIWGVCNGVYWPLLLILGAFIPFVGQLLSLVACVFLGVHGSEWAWKGRKWKSIEHFKRVQRRWAMAVLWYFVIGFFVVLIILVAEGY